MKTSREELLVVAFRLFLERGYEAVTMNDLVRAAGVSKGAFHHYFPRKNDLYRACVEHFFFRFLRGPASEATAETAPDTSRAYASEVAGEPEDLVRGMAAELLALAGELEASGIPFRAHQRFMLGLDSAWQELIAERAASLRRELEAAWSRRWPGAVLSPADFAAQAMSLVEGYGVLCAHGLAPIARLPALVDSWLASLPGGGRTS